MSQTTERILGIDPGLQHLGYGVIDVRGRESKLVDCGCISPNTKIPLPERLRTLYGGVLDVIDRHRPDIVTYEALLYHRNVRTALLLGQARGATIVAVASRNLPMLEFSPTAVKNAVVGKGKAGKEQIQKMVQLLLGLPAPPESEHAADALAVALTYAHERDVKKLLEKAASA